MSEADVERVPPLQRIAAELAPEIELLLSNTLRGNVRAEEKLRRLLWDNKVGILRVLESVAAQREDR